MKIKRNHLSLLKKRALSQLTSEVSVFQVGVDYGESGGDKTVVTVRKGIQVVTGVIEPSQKRRWSPETVASIDTLVGVMKKQFRLTPHEAEDLRSLLNEKVCLMEKKNRDIHNVGGILRTIAWGECKDMADKRKLKNDHETHIDSSHSEEFSQPTPRITENTSLESKIVTFLSTHYPTATHIAELRTRNWKWDDVEADVHIPHLKCRTILRQLATTASTMKAALMKMDEVYGVQDPEKHVDCEER